MGHVQGWLHALLLCTQPSTPPAQIHPPAVLAQSASHWVLTHAALPRGSWVSARGLVSCTTRLAVPELGKEATGSHQRSREHPGTRTNLSSSSPAGERIPIRSLKEGQNVGSGNGLIGPAKESD
ncbi:Transport And Golgi Organization Protein 1 [Manis pentadactyla]|nr:Transport And Golgi Organization Protein 1 [Manis pentadactyla]